MWVLSNDNGARPVYFKQAQREEGKVELCNERFFAKRFENYTAAIAEAKFHALDGFKPKSIWG